VDSWPRSSITCAPRQCRTGTQKCGLTCDMSGGRKQAKLAGGRPLDGGVSRHRRTSGVLDSRACRLWPAATLNDIGSATPCLSVYMLARRSKAWRIL
jgi:hypothetical protein